MLQARDKVRKKLGTEVWNIEFISTQPSKFFVFTFLSLQFKFCVHSCILCCLSAFPSHPFAYLNRDNVQTNLIIQKKPLAATIFNKLLVAIRNITEYNSFCLSAKRNLLCKVL